VVITNFPDDRVDHVEVINNPEDPSAGTRPVPFTRELYIEHDDFMEDPPKKFFRLAPGREVRLRYGYFITCTDVVKNATGEIAEIHCTYDPLTRGGDSPDGRKVQGTIHWVSASHALDCELRLYDKLFTVPDPDALEEGKDFMSVVNPDSLKIERAKIEPSVGNDPAGTRYQFERTAYFISDVVDSKPGALVFNRTVTLRDTWAKIKPK
jgi:glutaminyl-tRNA synthetase